MHLCSHWASLLLSSLGLSFAGINAQTSFSRHSLAYSWFSGALSSPVWGFPWCQRPGFSPVQSGCWATQDLVALCWCFMQLLHCCQSLCLFYPASGTAIVTEEHAAMWTDGRYFLQAAKQMDSNWMLMKMGTCGTSTHLSESGFWERDVEPFRTPGSHLFGQYFESKLFLLVWVVITNDHN